MPDETAPQWCEVDIAFTGPDAANPYTDVDAWVIFSHESGRQLRRPLFWDGDQLPSAIRLNATGGRVAVERSLRQAAP